MKIPEKARENSIRQIQLITHAIQKAHSKGDINLAADLRKKIEKIKEGIK